MTEEQDPKMGNGIAGFFDRSSFFAIVLLLLILIVSLYVVVAPHPVDLDVCLGEDLFQPIEIHPIVFAIEKQGIVDNPTAQPLCVHAEEIVNGRHDDKAISRFGKCKIRLVDGSDDTGIKKKKKKAQNKKEKKKKKKEKGPKCLDCGSVLYYT